MTIQTKRRLLRLSLVAVSGAAALWLHWQSQAQLQNPAYTTGWIMLVLLMLLLAFNARKKLPFLPLGSARAWAQWHYYSGMLLGILFLLHVQLRWPNGWFESVLFTAFALAMLSGFLGLYISRSVPRLLTKRGELVLYDRIPAFAHQLRGEIENCVARSVHQLRSSAIAKFYNEQLMAYLLKPQHFWSHVFDSGTAYKQWEQQFATLHRYLDKPEIELLNEIKQLFLKKIDLDMHYAGQTLLRRWLFLHIPLSYFLLCWVLFHLILTYSYTGHF